MSWEGRTEFFKERSHNTPKHPGLAMLRFFRKFYELDWETGAIYSTARGKRRQLGTKSNGNMSDDGYPRIYTHGKTFKLHHIVWFLSRRRWPRRQINHKDGNKLNPAPGNLELSTDAENQAEKNERLRREREENAA